MAGLQYFSSSYQSILETAKVEEIALAIESISDGFLTCDDDGIISYANARLHKLVPELIEWPEKSLALILLNKLTGDNNGRYLTEALQKKEERSFDFKHEPTKSWYHVTIYPLQKGASIHFREITIYKKALEDAINAKRLYAFISQVNEVMLRAESVDEIYRAVCQIAIDTGGFLLAWIGQKNEQTHIIEPYCAAGPGIGYLNAIKKITTDKVPSGMGPSGTALREGRSIYCNDIATDPYMQPWKDAALQNGFHSSIALPLFLENNAVALFTLYASNTNAFSPDEIRLLTQVCNNISFGLQSIANSVKRKKVEAQLQKVSQAVNQSSASIVITDAAGNIEYVNPAFCELTGYTMEEALGKNPKILKTDKTPPEVYRNMWTSITNKKTWRGELCNRTKNGTLYWESVSISPILDVHENITHYVAVKENITEKKKLDEEQKMLAKIIENTNAYVAIGKIDRQILYGNRKMREVLGILPEEDITLLNIADFRTQKSESLVHEIDAALLEHGKWMGENSYRSRSGKEINVWQVFMLHSGQTGGESLISTTAIDISNLKEAEQQTQQLNKELRELSNYLLKISELEKKEIAREIHDDLGQKLTAMKFDAAWLKKHLQNTAPEKLEKRIDEMLQIMHETSDVFRRILTSLHPAMLEDMGLKKSLDWMLNAFEKKTDIPVTYQNNLSENQTSTSIDIVVYRIMQECLTNIMRYAHARKVQISIMKQEEVITMQITDDGKGFDIEKVDTSLHHGLLGIRERLVAIQGKLSIQSKPGKGTHITAVIPPQTLPKKHDIVNG